MGFRLCCRGYVGLLMMVGGLMVGNALLNTWSLESGLFWVGVACWCGGANLVMQKL